MSWSHKEESRPRLENEHEAKISSSEFCCFWFEFFWVIFIFVFSVIFMEAEIWGKLGLGGED